ncbi:unnamed protein product [Cercopithifilaria johnstoni]|uniref:Uncharacterized protein n=1 Tax=Cercopithifilaria johnstoni TaxID=2874296 RepID=A0A8J2Q920_9BILA|nr:unnamed protein product [Cercopithifilaria johnstoni]
MFQPFVHPFVFIPSKDEILLLQCSQHSITSTILLHSSNHYHSQHRHRIRPTDGTKGRGNGICVIGGTVDDKAGLERAAEIDIK